MGTIKLDTLEPQGSNQSWTAIYYCESMIVPSCESRTKLLPHCEVNGAEIGRGTGPNQDAAVVNAATNAYEHVKSLPTGSQQGG